MNHNIKPGVAVGKEVQEIFQYAKQKGFALPAANVISSNSINGVLEAAVAMKAPVIIQFFQREELNLWQARVFPTKVKKPLY